MAQLIRCRLSRFLLLTAVLMSSGCGGGTTPPPAQEGRNPFSYDDDEIDPANLKKTKKAQTKSGR